MSELGNIPDRPTKQEGEDALALSLSCNVADTICLIFKFLVRL